MQARGQFPEPPRTPLGSHLHPVPIPSLRSWRCCLVQSRQAEAVTVPQVGQAGTGRAGLSLCRQRGSSCQSHGASAACFP